MLWLDGLTLRRVDGRLPGFFVCWAAVVDHCRRMAIQKEWTGCFHCPSVLSAGKDQVMDMLPF